MTYDFGIMVAIIIALNEVIKRAGLGTKWITAISVVLGLVAGYFFLDATTIKDAILNGIMVGLSANGLFDMSKIIKK